MFGRRRQAARLRREEDAREQAYEEALARLRQEYHIVDLGQTKFVLAGFTSKGELARLARRSGDSS